MESLSIITSPQEHVLQLLRVYWKTEDMKVSDDL